MAYYDNVCMTLLLKFVAVGVSFNTEFWLCVLNIVDIALWTSNVVSFCTKSQNAVITGADTRCTYSHMIVSCHSLQLLGEYDKVAWFFTAPY